MLPCFTNSGHRRELQTADLLCVCETISTQSLYRFLRTGRALWIIAVQILTHPVETGSSQTDCVSLSSTFLSSVVFIDVDLGWRPADGQATHLPGDRKPRAMARPPTSISNSYVSGHFCLIRNLPFVQEKVFVLFNSEQLSEVSHLPNWHFTKFCALHEWRNDELSSQRKTSKVHQRHWP